MKEIKLTRGKFALVDDESYEELSRYKWHYSQQGYAARGNYKDKKRSIVMMHWHIVGKPEKGYCTDHIDRDKLNNTKANLRIVTISQNGMNKLKSKVNTSGYKGVSWNKYAKKYTATIVLNKKTIHLGKFNDPQDAYKAYCEGCKIYHGEFANFG